MAHIADTTFLPSRYLQIQNFEDKTRYTGNRVAERWDPGIRSSQKQITVIPTKSALSASLTGNAGNMAQYPQFLTLVKPGPFLWLLKLLPCLDIFSAHNARTPQTACR